MAGTVPIRFGKDPTFIVFECYSVFYNYALVVTFYGIFLDFPSVAKPLDYFYLLTSGMCVI